MIATKIVIYPTGTMICSLNSNKHHYLSDRNAFLIAEDPNDRIMVVSPRTAEKIKVNRVPEPLVI